MVLKKLYKIFPFCDISIYSVSYGGTQHLIISRFLAFATKSCVIFFNFPVQGKTPVTFKFSTKARNWLIIKVVLVEGSLFTVWI